MKLPENQTESKKADAVYDNYLKNSSLNVEKFKFGKQNRLLHGAMPKVYIIAVYL